MDPSELDAKRVRDSEKNESARRKREMMRERARATKQAEEEMHNAVWGSKASPSHRMVERMGIPPRLPPSPGENRNSTASDSNLTTPQRTPNECSHGYEEEEEGDYGDHYASGPYAGLAVEELNLYNSDLWSFDCSGHGSASPPGLPLPGGGQSEASMGPDAVRSSAKSVWSSTLSDVEVLCCHSRVLKFPHLYLTWRNTSRSSLVVCSNGVRCGAPR